MAFFGEFKVSRINRDPDNGWEALVRFYRLNDHNGALDSSGSPILTRVFVGQRIFHAPFATTLAQIKVALKSRIADWLSDPPIPEQDPNA